MTKSYRCDLRVLDLHENHLISLPGSLGQLKSLLSLGGGGEVAPQFWDGQIQFPTSFGQLVRVKLRIPIHHGPVFWHLFGDYHLIHVVSFVDLHHVVILYSTLWLSSIWRSYD